MPVERPTTSSSTTAITAMGDISVAWEASRRFTIDGTLSWLWMHSIILNSSSRLECRIVLLL